MSAGRLAAAGLPAVHHPGRPRCPTSRRCSPARSASRWSRSPTPSPPRRPSRRRRGRGRRRQPGDDRVGAANLAAGLFQGFPVSTSGSRTAVAEQAGAKTQVTGWSARSRSHRCCCCVPGAPARPPEPHARRGRDRGVAVARRHPWDRAACSSSAEPSSPSRSRRSSASPCSACSRGSAWRSPCRSLNVFRRSWWPYQTVLGRVAGIPGLPRRAQLPRMPSCLPAARHLPVRRSRCSSPTRGRSATRSDALATASPPPRWIIVAAEPITDVDTTAADMLEALDERIERARRSRWSSPR